MNGIVKETEFENPWKEREKLPKASVKHIILAAIMCLISAVGIPLCNHAWFVPVAVMLLLCFYVAYSARSPFSVLVILLTAFSMLMIGPGFAGVSVALSLVVGAMALAYLLTVLKHSYLALLLPLSGFGIVFALSGDWRFSLLSLVFVPAGALLALATVTAKNRTTAICFTAAGFLISLLVLCALWIQMKTGGVGREQILAVIHGIKDAVMREITPIRNELFAIAEESKNAWALQVAQSFDSFYNEEMILRLMQLAPAVAVVICSVLAFDAQLLLGMTYFSTGFSAFVPKRARIFTMSLTAAVLYCASFLLLLFVPSGSMAAAVIQNVCLILMPGFAFLGVRGLAVSFARAKGGMRVFLIIFTVVMLCCSSELIFYILGLWGAYGRITEEIGRKMFEKMLRDGRDHSGDEE